MMTFLILTFALGRAFCRDVSMGMFLPVWLAWMVAGVDLGLRLGLIR